jgi:hypothetical protein
MSARAGIVASIARARDHAVGGIMGPDESAAIESLCDAVQGLLAVTPGIDVGPASGLLYSARQVCAQHGFPGAGGGIGLAAWLQHQFAQLDAARSCVETLRTCVRDDIVIVEAAGAVNAYDDAAAAAERASLEGLHRG